MFTIARERDLTPAGSRTATFQGSDHGAGISFFHVRNDPGQGPRLHTHPYTETWVVLAGEALIIAGDERIDARPGDIVTVEAGVPHAFRNTGAGTLEIMCIHDSPRFRTTWLEAAEATA